METKEIYPEPKTYEQATIESLLNSLEVAMQERDALRAENEATLKTLESYRAENEALREELANRNAEIEGLESERAGDDLAMEDAQREIERLRALVPQWKLDQAGKKESPLSLNDLRERMEDCSMTTKTGWSMTTKTWRNAAGVEILIPPEYTTHEEYEAALRAEVKRLRAALAEMLDSFTEPEDDNDILRRARAALGSHKWA